jgi:hypothetical protein
MRSSYRAPLALLLVLALFSLAPSDANAQTVTGTMQGTITDRTGAALPGVTVTIRNLDTGLERVVTTNDNGFFSAPYLPIGRYSVNAQLAGLGSGRRQGVPINLNETTRQDFVIDPQVSESITVSADAPRINVTDGEVKQTMRSTEIELLPMSDQTNINRLASVFSGYQENPTSGQDNPALSSGSSVNFNGTGTRGATFQINGVNNDDSSENQNRQNVPVATIKSYQILTNSFSSEFGRGYGSVVLVQTKQGTNDVDGEVYAYAQDNKYVSRDILQVSLDHGNKYRRQFGMTSGFPIMRDRLFFFGSVDQIQNKGTLSETRGLFLPSDLNPANRLTLGNDNPANRAWQDAILARFPQGATPNAPNIATRAYQALKEQNIPSRDFSGRLDFNAAASNTLTARYQKSHQEENLGELVLGEVAAKDLTQSNFGLTWTNILTSDTVQEARVGLGIRHTQWAPIDPTTPVVRFAATGVPVFTILGNAGAFPIIRDQRDTQLVYNISTSRWEDHTIKVGTDLRRGKLDDRADNFNRGFWNFAAVCNGVNYGTGIAAFWAGCVGTYTESFGPNALKHRLDEQNAYFQDDWRPFDNLVLNLGARYERVEPPKEADNLVDYQFDTNQYIDPRLGFAYTPEWDGNRLLRAVTGGNGKFSIRGGFGIFHGRVFQSSFSQGGASVRYNPPNAATLTFTSTNLADPTNGFVFTPGFQTVRVAPTFVDPDLQMPESRQWNLTFERQVFWNSRLRASYIGTLGKNLLFYEMSNAPVLPAPPGTAGAMWVVAADAACAGTGTPGVAVTAACPVAVPIAANEVSFRVPRTNERRPDARYTDVRTVTNGTASRYHSGQLEWETGEVRGFAGRATYTFGKALDFGSEATFVGTGDVNLFPDRAGNVDYAYGLSRFDVRHRFTMAASYRLPWLRDNNSLAGSLLGGWTLSTLIRLASGSPYTITDSGAPDFLFLGAATAPLRPVCVREEYCGGLHVNNRAKGPIPRDAFRHPQYGDDLDDLMRRNTYFADGAETVDAGLYKTFKLPVNLALMIRLDAFNVLNHTNWWYPVTDFNAANFGVLNQTAYSATVAGAPTPLAPPRTLQLGVRLIY